MIKQKLMNKLIIIAVGFWILLEGYYYYRDGSSLGPIGLIIGAAVLAYTFILYK